jgi:hypothetical protein
MTPIVAGAIAGSEARCLKLAPPGGNIRVRTIERQPRGESMRLPRDWAFLSLIKNYFIKERNLYG